MKSKNYYCNDEIDRTSCPLDYDEFSDAYKIGSRKVPSLNEVIGVVSGKTRKVTFERLEKNEILQSLHYFLLTGEKGERPLSNPVYDQKEAYAKTLNVFLDGNFYKKDTPKNTITRFTYNKKVELEGVPSIYYYIYCLQKELFLNVGYLHHMEEIAGLEKYFYEKVNTLSNCNVAWFAQFENVGRLHYHLAKKQSERENLYFASQIDISTKDTLYYIETEADYSLESISLYLNIQNIDLKKEHLKALIITPTGSVEEVLIRKFNEEELDDIIKHYKNKNILYLSVDNRIKEETEKSSQMELFNIKDYINSLIPIDEKEKPLGFPLSNLLPEKHLLKPHNKIKEEKEKVLRLLIASLKGIKEAYKKYSVEYILLAVGMLKYYLKDIIDAKTPFLFSDNKSIENFINVSIENAQVSALKLGNALKTEEKELYEAGFQEVKYQDVTLDLRVTEMQKEALMEYLYNNLIVSKASIDGSVGNEKYIQVSQLTNFKERKKLKTLSGNTVDFTGLYKKTNTFYGCVKANKILEAKITDVRLFYVEGKDRNSLPHFFSIFVDCIGVDCIEMNEKQDLKLRVDITDKRLFEEIKFAKKTEEKLKEEINSTNELLTLFFDTFSIKRGDFNFSSWIGKQGKVAVVSNETIKKVLDDEDTHDFDLSKGKGILFVTEERLEDN